MSFEQDFKKALENAIERDTDKYTELQYSDQIYVHVAGHPDGGDAFELYAILPHEETDKSLIDRDSGAQLSPDIDGVEEFYEDIDRLVEEVTGNSQEIVFYLLEVVDDGAWERDATSYATNKLEG